MSGKYADTRVYQHLVRTYSRVPYQDTEIFNVQQACKHHQALTQKGYSTADQGIQKAQALSEKLHSAIASGRASRERDTSDFMAELESRQESLMQRQKEMWSSYKKQRQENRMGAVKDGLYLDSLLKTNATKAESRLTSVRRWH